MRPRTPRPPRASEQTPTRGSGAPYPLRGGNFYGSGCTFPGEELPAGEREIGGTAFLFPGSAVGRPSLHIFALSLQPAACGRALEARLGFQDRLVGLIQEGPSETGRMKSRT